MNGRRNIAQRIIARWKARGHDLEANGAFMELVNLWVEETIDMVEMQSRYLSLLKTRAMKQQTTKQNQSMKPADLVADSLEEDFVGLPSGEGKAIQFS